MNKNNHLVIFVPPANLKNYISVYRAIKSYTDMNLDVPARLVQFFFDQMQNPEKFKMDQVYEKANKYSKLVLHKLKSKKGYQFEWEDTILKKTGSVIKNDTAKIFLELIIAYLLFDSDRKANKDDAIGFFYIAFEDEYKNKIKAAGLKKMTPYRLGVISGILAIAVGFRLTSKADPTNEEIFQATRNAIRNAPNNPKF